jgi:hypothetical protein
MGRPGAARHGDPRGDGLAGVSEPARYPVCDDCEPCCGCGGLHPEPAPELPPEHAPPAWWEEPLKAALVLVLANLIGWAVVIAAGYGFLELARWCAGLLP